MLQSDETCVFGSPDQPELRATWRSSRNQGSIQYTNPDSKDLKKLVRDVISPKQDLGHIDGHKGGEKKEVEKDAEKESGEREKPATEETAASSAPACTDCESGSCN